MDRTDSPRIAVACQGGGSRTAFTAGVLGRLLEHYSPTDHRLEDQPADILAFSGTSGGAICALLAWYALISAPTNAHAAADLLSEFWSSAAATAWWDVALNAALVQTTRLQGYIALPQVSPYGFEAWRSLLQPPARDWLDGQRRLRQLLEQRVDFATLSALVQAAQPASRLLVGAVDVGSGAFRVFKSDAQPSEISIEAILASAALPTLFEAVEIDGSFYWDGLFSQNPPIHDFLSTSLAREQKPDEIWIIQINPESVTGVPHSTAAILTRRDALAGNLSLNQEVRFIQRVNAFIRQLGQRGVDLHPDMKEVRIARITMSPRLADQLDAASKLDRDPRLLRSLEAHGREQAGAFLRQRAQGTVNWES